MLKWINHPPPSPLLPPRRGHFFSGPSSVDRQHVLLQLGNATNAMWQLVETHFVRKAIWRFTWNPSPRPGHFFPGPSICWQAARAIVGPEHSLLLPHHPVTGWQLLKTCTHSHLASYLVFDVATDQHCGCNDFSIVSFLHYCVLYTKVCRSCY